MALYQAFSTEAQITGGIIQALIEGLWTTKDEIHKKLADKGLKELKSYLWYPQQPYLDVLSEINSDINLKMAGTKIAYTARFPLEVRTIMDAMSSIEQFYKLNHQYDEVGFYRFTKSGHNSGNIECHSPYPCAFDEGVVTGFARRYADKNAHIRLEHDFSKECKKNGKNSCLFVIHW